MLARMGITESGREAPELAGSLPRKRRRGQSRPARREASHAKTAPAAHAGQATLADPCRSALQPHSERQGWLWVHERP